MKKIIIISILVLAIAAVVGAVVFLPKSTEPDKEVKDPLYVSMEDDANPVTEDDIKEQQEIEDYARVKAVEYFKTAYPDSKNVLIDSVEWYFTDDSDLNNLLARASIVDSNEVLIKDMIVLELSTTTPSELLRIYKPDERYSL